MVQPPAVGFQTGRGKKMEINAESLKKAQKLFEDEGQEQIQEMNDSSILMELLVNSIESPMVQPPTVGFQTGRGKKMEVNPESLKKAHQLFQDEREEGIQNNEPMIPPMVGFQSGRGKKMEINA